VVFRFSHDSCWQLDIVLIDVGGAEQWRSWWELSKQERGKQ